MKNLPSIKTLQTIKDVTLEDARKVRAILECKSVDAVTELSESADRYVRQCYNKPPLQTVKLTAADSILRTFGVEYISRGRGAKSPSIEYCNTGDTYASTLMWTRGRYIVGCWGDIVERGNYD